MQLNSHIFSSTNRLKTIGKAVIIFYQILDFGGACYFDQCILRIRYYTYSNGDHQNERYINNLRDQHQDESKQQSHLESGLSDTNGKIRNDLHNDSVSNKVVFNGMITEKSTAFDRDYRNSLKTPYQLLWANEMGFLSTGARLLFLNF